MISKSNTNIIEPVKLRLRAGILVAKFDLGNLLGGST
jgi:hypothetical protein